MNWIVKRLTSNDHTTRHIKGGPNSTVTRLLVYVSCNISPMRLKHGFILEEDALLEDMCAMTDIEYDKDPLRMTKADKLDMMKTFSKKEQTKEFFESERAFSNFIQKQIK